MFAQTTAANQVIDFFDLDSSLSSYFLVVFAHDEDTTATLVWVGFT